MMKRLIRAGAWACLGGSVALGGVAVAEEAVVEEAVMDWKAWGVGHAREAAELAPRIFFADGEIGLGMVARGDLQGLAGQTLVRLGDAEGAGSALEGLERTRKGVAEPLDRAGLDWVRADVLAQLGRMEEARAAAAGVEDPAMRLLAEGLCALALGEAGDEAGMRRALEGLMEALPAALKAQLQADEWSEDWVMYQLVDMGLLAGDVEGAMAMAGKVPDPAVRHETLGRVAMALAEAGRAGEARRVVEKVEAYLEAQEARTLREGGIEQCEDCVDVGPIRIELVGAWSALGQWERARAQVERSDPEWPGEKAQGLALMAVYMTGPDQSAARRLALEQAVGLMEEMDSDWSRAWSTFYVGRDIARCGDTVVAELLLGSDKRPIVKGYAHAGLAWGAMMRVAPKRLGAGLAMER